MLLYYIHWDGIMVQWFLLFPFLVVSMSTKVDNVLSSHFIIPRFALGAVLYQLLFRTFAFVKETKIQSDIATRLGDLPLIPCGRPAGLPTCKGRMDEGTKGCFLGGSKNDQQRPVQKTSQNTTLQHWVKTHHIYPTSMGFHGIPWVTKFWSSRELRYPEEAWIAPCSSWKFQVEAALWTMGKLRVSSWLMILVIVRSHGLCFQYRDVSRGVSRDVIILIFGNELKWMIVEHGADGALQFPRMIIIFLIKKTFFDKPNLYVQATIYRPSLCRLNPPSHCLRARETSSSARGSQREFLPQIWWDVICRFAWKCWENKGKHAKFDGFSNRFKISIFLEPIQRFIIPPLRSGTNNWVAVLHCGTVSPIFQQVARLSWRLRAVASRLRQIWRRVPFDSLASAERCLWPSLCGRCFGPPLVWSGRPLAAFPLESSMFLVGHSRAASFLRRLRLPPPPHTQLSHTHNLLTHTHNLSSHNFHTHHLLTHNLSSHTSSHTTYSHTHTHNLSTHNLSSHNFHTHHLLTHNFLTHNLLPHTTCPHTSSHTTYSHTTCPHTTCPHTTFTHTHTTYPHTTCPHTTSSRTTYSHTTYSHTQLVHKQLPHTQLTHTHTTCPHTTCPHTTSSHTTCPHTTCPHATCPHTTSSHITYSHTTSSHTRNFLRHNSLTELPHTHTTSSHTTCPHTQLTHTHTTCPRTTCSHTTCSHTTWHLALGDIDLHFAWQV